MFPINPLRNVVSLLKFTKFNSKLGCFDYWNRRCFTLFTIEGLNLGPDVSLFTRGIKPRQEKRSGQIAFCFT